MTDTPFTTFGFKATGATTNRTMPDRLAEVKNVLDFGADPTGNGGTATATTAAIQAAVDAAVAAGGGTVYFPGIFAINDTITFNHNGAMSIRFVGSGGSSITSNMNKFLFDRHNVNSGSPIYTHGNWVFENIGFSNSYSCTDLVTGGCVRVGSSSSAAFYNCSFVGQVGATAEDSSGSSSQNILFENCTFVGTQNSPYIACGIIFGGTGFVAGCDFNAMDVGLRVYGSGFAVESCRAENCNVGYLIGVDSDSATQGGGGGTDRGASGFSVTGSSCEGDDIGGWLKGTCTGFTFGSGAQGHPTSGYPIGRRNSQYGYRIGANCSYGVLTLSMGSVIDVEGISIATASSRANLLFTSCNSVVGAGAGTAYGLPTNAYTATFENCNTNPIWTYSQLPTGGNVVEGDLFNISDANTSTWGASVTASGGTAGVVRWNGSNYTLVGK